MKKKYKFFIVLILLFLVSLVSYNELKENNVYEENIKFSKNAKSISMNLEQTAGAGDYKTVTQSNWPTEGYKFNKDLSRCENGSTLSWDDSKKAVVMNGNVSDKCYVYFDKVLTLANYVISQYTGIQGENSLYYHDSSLANGVGDNSYRYAGGDFKLTTLGKSTGAIMIIGYNNSVTNALIDFYCDGIKQYVGYATSCSTHYYVIKNDTTQYQTYNEVLNAAIEKGYLTDGNVKNFVCFGTTASSCPTENLYRIIGVIDNKVKLIKWDYADSILLGRDGDYSKEFTKYYFSGRQGESQTNNPSYYWNKSGTNTWSESNLNKINLNKNFINNIGSIWSSMIATTIWKVGGGTSTNIKSSLPKIAYNYEVGTNAFTTTYSAKIGLMYASDYYYGASSSAWTLLGYNSDDDTKDYRSVKEENWLYGGAWDWLITRNSSGTKNAFIVGFDGLVYSDSIVDFHTYVVRPTFNLESTVTYSGGLGTKLDPIRVN